jgi:hypothetical protein
VIAVRPAAGHVQEEVQLGGRGPQGLVSHEFQPSTTKRSRTP